MNFFPLLLCGCGNNTQTMTTFCSHTVYNNNNVIIDRLLFVTQIIIIATSKCERENPNNKVFTVEIFENKIFFITAPTRFYDICI